MPDCQNSQIYKLVSNKTTDIYIGSCLMRLSTRLSNHKSKRNPCVSKILFNDNAIVTIVLIESYPCKTKTELKARELHHITTNKCININKPFVCDIPFGDGKEWRKEYTKMYCETNSQHLCAYQKTYNDMHRDQVNARQREYTDTHQDQINTQRRASRAEKKLALNLQNNLNNNIII